MPITKIIYSMRVMLKLVEKGFTPLATMPNPQHPEFNCWVFELTDSLQEELDRIMEVKRHG